jgi:hypothetical protein
VPAGQTHAEPSHTSVAAHALPHVPQSSGSAVTSTHDPPHAVYGGVVQLPTHAPAWQRVVVPLHAAPHAPQLAGSLPRSVQVEPQTCSSDGQRHLPALHASPAAQAFPHAPQLDGSLVVSVQVDPHSISPMAQGDWQLPLEQTSIAAQACPHEPQFWGSPARLKHCAPHAVWAAGHVMGGGGAQSPDEVQVSPAVQSESCEQAMLLPPQLTTTTAIATAKASAMKGTRKEGGRASIVIAAKIARGPHDGSWTLRGPLPRIGSVCSLRQSGGRSSSGTP